MFDNYLELYLEFIIKMSYMNFHYYYLRNKNVEKPYMLPNFIPRRLEFALSRV